MIAPIITLSISLIIWTLVPLKKGVCNIDKEINIIIVMAITSISIYGILYSGWSSNSKYGLLGSIRGISQLISYEVSIGLIILNIIIINNSFNFFLIIQNQIFFSNFFLLFPLSILFFLTILAECLRSPFDILEAEGELVAGNIVEYGGFTFGALYLAEYSNMFFYSGLSSILFFGSYILSPFTFIFLFLFIWIRASLPRLRWDQLLTLFWSKILPFTISYLYLISSLFLF
jgi:NADH-quinone oxidoreductase subunit H